ncbi:histidine phosphatase family protein [Lacticaseibacillus kribbianus]|uniref:histidine phosphatase family protein n=1 Tax=Lacticaseibacillus kribbianus TaxID=2926292 RepID=UPI001CD24B63|nr:histidine phosphatase family protein [Lacticaseibacillus kribbianus]
MQIDLIRHSEPDYGQVRAADYFGFGLDFSQLTPRGVAIAQAAARDPRLQGVELLLSSPYTRALQTALELTRHTTIPVQVELGLHEWRPDMTGTRLRTAAQADEAHAAFLAHHGQATPDSPWDYETAAQVRARAAAVFDRYADQGFHHIACVTHGVVMRQFHPQAKIGYCEFITIDWR